VDKLERIAEALRSLDLGEGVAVEGRTFVGPADAISRLRDLEGIASGLASRDLFALYERRIAHDGVFEADINESGRYYAYLLYELKGATPEEKEARLAAALEDLVSQYGKDAVLGRIPERIAGRQVTESLVLRPESEDYPAYYSKMRMPYAEKMALEELPKAVLAGIRADQERLLDSFGWTTLRVQETGEELVDICGDAYLLTKKGRSAVEPYRAIWAALVGQGPEAFYDYEVRIDGIYEPDIDEELGRYYAYVRASLKGQAPEEKRKILVAALPAEAVKAIGAEAAAAIFKERIDGDQVTASLTIRPEADDFPSYFNAKKIDAGNARLGKQIAINVQAEVIQAAERVLGGVQKYVILE
jgi:plasmid stability protein